MKPRSVFTRLDVRIAASMLPVVAVTLLLFALAPAGLDVVTILAVAAASIASMVLSFWFVRGALRRIELLNTAFDRVGQGNLNARVRPRGNDEIDALMRAFNTMLDDVNALHARLEVLQRIGAWQDFARRLAHEIKNPLTPIQLAVQEVARKYNGDDAAFARTLATAKEIVEEEVETLRRLVTAFSNFARLPEVHMTRGDLAEFVRDAAQGRSLLDDAIRADLASDSETPPAIHFDCELDTIPVLIDRVMLRRALDNLVLNAVQVGARNVWVHTTVRDDQVWLTVDDDGPGIPEASRARVFEPYFTTRKEGTGLGLPIVRKIVLDHRGDVGLESSSRGGARFVITLPREDAVAVRRLTFVTFSGSAVNAQVPVAPAPNPAPQVAGVSER